MSEHFVPLGDRMIRFTASTPVAARRRAVRFIAASLEVAGFLRWDNEPEPVGGPNWGAPPRSTS